METLVDIFINLTIASLVSADNNYDKQSTEKNIFELQTLRDNKDLPFKPHHIKAIDDSISILKKELKTYETQRQSYNYSK